MNINFKSKKVELTSETKDYASEKVASLIKFLGEDVDSKDVRFDISFTKKTRGSKKGMFRVDIVVFSGKVDMHAVGHGESLNASIDVAKDDLARRLSRNKGKRRNILRRGSRAIKNMFRFGR